MASPGPSLPGAFGILEAVDRDRLILLKHKLRTLPPGCQGAKLLHAMVLLTLGQDTEARISLETLKGDTVAQLLAHQWAGMDNAETPEEPSDVAWTVARLYHLLAKESLCPASMRDMAYEVALSDLTSRGDHRLGQLQAEARDRHGLDIVGDPGGFQPLHSDLGCLPPPSASPSVARSQPLPIHQSNWSPGCSLRSTGSPGSLSRHLAISQSPTLPFLGPHRGSHGLSRLCDTPPANPEPQPVPIGGQEPEEVSWPPCTEMVTPLELPGRIRDPEVALATLHNSQAPDNSGHDVVESTEVTTDPKSLQLSTMEDTGKLESVISQVSSQVSVGSDALQNTTSSPPAPPSPQQTSPHAPPPSSPSSASPSSSSHPPPMSSLSPPPGHSETSEQKFYNFVVIHARADEHIALRVREKLERLGVPDGATFCEDFQVPGRGELSCLQDAIDHSGFMVLLLTASFDCRLSLHQVNQTLMNSLTQSGRQDCVIPLLPLECSRAHLNPDTVGLLTGLVWLDEHSSIFTRKVANTFKPHKLQAHKARWKREQEAKILREHNQQLDAERQRVASIHTAYSTYVQSCWAWQAQMDSLRMAFGKDLALGSQGPLGGPSPIPAWLGCPQNLLYTQQRGSQVPPSFPQPPPSFLQPPMSSPQSPHFPPTSPLAQTPGTQPLIIHHAQMVQLGVNNHMWGQTGNP
uniref:TIR domain-containing adapter molecule 1 n=2 Tax=Nannospalax galili TaxID=1026970 RepID=A0A8C6R353_NANGA